MVDRGSTFKLFDEWTGFVTDCNLGSIRQITFDTWCQRFEKSHPCWTFQHLKILHLQCNLKCTQILLTHSSKDRFWMYKVSWT